MRVLKMFIGGFIWDFAETFKINLGSLGPHVFAWMIGCDNYRRVDTESKEKQS